MKTSKVIYPIQITGLLLPYCDICGEESEIEFYSICHVNTIAWRCCNLNNCKDILENSKELFTVSLSDLKLLFGNKISVIRSSGEIQTDWEIVSMAYYFKTNKMWIITTTDNTQTLTKTFIFQYLVKYNPNIDINSPIFKKLNYPPKLSHQVIHPFDIEPS